MDPESFEQKAIDLLKLMEDPNELSEPITIRFERIGVASRKAWIESSAPHPILQLINSALNEGGQPLQKKLRLYVLPNLHLIGVSVGEQQGVVDRLPEPLRSEWLSTQQDLDAIQKQAE